MSTQASYGIIGAGAIGQALGACLRRAGKEVLFWDRDESKANVASAQELTRRSSVIILAIPSEGVRAALKEVHADLHDLHTVLTVAKGVERGFVTMDKVLEAEVSSDSIFGVIYGPMLAGELIAGEGGYGVIASTQSLPSVVGDFTTGGLKLTASPHLAAVSLCGVLKNIYALGLGVADGLDLGMNAKAALSVGMISEMQLILRHLQLPEAVALQHCGLGDLLATGWGDASYNHRVGEEIGGGAVSGLGGEGLHSLMEIPAILEPTNFPILNSLHHIIVSKAPAEQLSDLIR
jgi:glycerol-3-phosphate dehydrogenase (NAD(P)+)